MRILWTASRDLTSLPEVVAALRELHIEDDRRLTAIGAMAVYWTCRLGGDDGQ